MPMPKQYFWLSSIFNDCLWIVINRNFRFPFPLHTLWLIVFLQQYGEAVVVERIHFFLLSYTTMKRFVGVSWMLFFLCVCTHFIINDSKSNFAGVVRKCLVISNASLCMFHYYKSFFYFYLQKHEMDRNTFRSTETNI